MDEAVEELHEIKEFLENPKKFQALGARIPKGVLLYGPPGTGKTLLARAVAGEAGVPFFSISGSDFVEMFVGVGASRVRDLFEQAKQNSPCIIFMDEIDAVGRHRGAGLGGGHDEREQTLNQLLVEMDGFEMKDNIILIAATNRPDILDPALLRPGRFDRQIVVDRPDRKGRAKILEVHTRGKPLAKAIDLDNLAGQTPGFTGADLQNLVNEAALLAARQGKREIDHLQLEEGIMRVIAGPEKKTRVMREKERRITAFHEMGHAIVAHYLENTDPVHKISVISRGQALGYTISLPTEDKFLTTRAELSDTMAMTLGGRAAEEIVFGEVTTGASNDLEKVTATAKQMVMRFGMSEKLGPRVFGHDHGQPFLGREFSSEPDYSDDVAREIDDEIRRIVEEAHQVGARHPRAAPRASSTYVSEILLRRETIEREEFIELLDGKSEEEVFGADEPVVPPAPPPAGARGARAQARARARAAAAARPRRRHRRDARRWTRPRSRRAWSPSSSRTRRSSGPGWRQNHESDDEVYVGYWKKATGRQGMSWSQAVDQALCFGWIDGRLNRIDDERHMQRFTPRRPGSNWSKVNIEKVAKLEEAGLMRPAGRAAFEKRRKDRSGVYSFERESKLDARPGEALSRRQGGLEVVLGAGAVVPAHGDPLGRERQA